MILEVTFWVKDSKLQSFVASTSKSGFSEHHFPQQRRGTITDQSLFAPVKSRHRRSCKHQKTASETSTSFCSPLHYRNQRSDLLHKPLTNKTITCGRLKLSVLRGVSLLLQGELHKQNTLTELSGKDSGTGGAFCSCFPSTVYTDRLVCVRRSNLSLSIII